MVPFLSSFAIHTDGIASFRADTQDDYACAKTGRLWEDLLEKYPNVPFLLLRVADMRFSLDRKLTSLHLYLKLQSHLGDAGYGARLKQFHASLINEMKENLRHYMNNSHLFTPSQRWRKGTSEDPFPYCRLQRSRIEFLQTTWTLLGDNSQEVMSRYLNYHCIESNALEGTVEFHPSATTRLVQLGFYNEIETIGNEDIKSGAVRDRAEALFILQDTRKAFDLVFSMINDPNFQLTVETICRLHKNLMHSSRVLRIQEGGESRLTYLDIGVTRQETCVNVLIRRIRSPGEDPLVVQFCPYYEVNQELNGFCARFNELLRLPDMDPFAAASWISHVFISIHPFEDGNGRLSRILACIPLLKARLPPICIPVALKTAYFDDLNHVRANHDGDYSRLMRSLYVSTLTAVNALELFSRPAASV
ncbi:hypothetical protein DICSQDRAFT_152704 [Dichomitus squalens LYAD-421 SS1]|uniref:Fido domain-containing protein n=1 Tax=Dichomitus squalens TaxID=114155 RepID=A0A4Q9MZN4_9APHY|nr:uncharacterized protein DICSQDRAFT_152704 [Dichomitus squalens LYAD-421 SS1]EJF65537.1 hypothetical protein DICSQDRAFT_152704 [Dichomitus squalens LYAD-421 SS1]TBU33624.1 fido domain-containing protein [Dichomitus squalens]